MIKPLFADEVPKVFKFIRSIFFILLVITGLYFFGDFRINDTNVKDYLHTVITVENVKSISNQVQSVFNTIQKIINEFDDDVKFEDKFENKEPIKTLEAKVTNTSNTSNTASEPTKAQEKVFKHEKDKILNLIQTNINQPSSQEP